MQTAETNEEAPLTDRGKEKKSLEHFLFQFRFHFFDHFADHPASDGMSDKNEFEIGNRCSRSW